jgi:hypothetical protein
VDTLDGLPAIPSEFDPVLGTKPLSTATASAAPDVVGAFRFTFGFAGVGRFDPKVFPGDTTGKSHGHQFFGNTGINPNSTYEILRTSGKSTTSYGNYPLNRSAYWEPWIEDGKGNVIQDDHATIYYKRRPKTDPACSDKANTKYQGQCTDLPNGLFFIFGFDFLTNTTPTGKFKLTCVKDGVQTVPFTTFPEAANYPQCSAGGRLVNRAEAPSCWDGKRADSANHRDHVGYATVRNSTTGQYRCDDAHPYVIPAFTILRSTSIKEGDVVANWRYSSDHMRPDLPAGSTAHADFFMAWDPQAKRWWHDNCIDRLLNCSSGNLGNGTAISFAGQPMYPDATGKLIYNWENPHRVIPVPGDEANTKLVGY